MYVKSRMTANPITVSSETSVADAYELLLKHKVRRLPVVDNGKLVGIVTDKELQQLTPSKATTLSIYEINYLLAKTKVKEAMTTGVYTTTPNALLEEAAVMMRDHKVSALPVLNGEKLVGIITETNIFDAFTDLLGMREIGSRITVSAEDTPGTLSRLTKIISEDGVNINRLAVYRSEGAECQIVISINSINTEALEASLNNQGFKVLNVAQNKR
ncbi:MAG: CBS domain-containing protein [Bacillota bacterium]|nr:CBS domain-containing protein [Bacillota bacterium]